jgi:serine/threonine protein kinase
MLFNPGDIVVDRYHLRRRLSRNGTRETWLVSDDRSGMDCVLKFLYFGDDTDWQDLKLMEREAKTLQLLQHPNIPRYSDAFWMERPEGHYFCLLQQFIAGVTLAEQIKQGLRYSEPELERLARAMLDILEYLHTQSPPVVHRDIKPSNILFGADGQFFLIDFGAVQAQAAGRGTMTVVGTFGYMPPEQFAAQSVPASDLYALGATLLHLATGVDPAEMPRKGVQIVLAPELNLAKGWHRWFERLLEPDLEKRLACTSAALIEFGQRNQLPTVEVTITEAPITKRNPVLSLIKVLATGFGYTIVAVAVWAISVSVALIAGQSHPENGFIYGILTSSFLLGFIVLLARNEMRKNLKM